MKKFLVVVCLLSLASCFTSCKKQCACTVHDNTIYVDEADLNKFINSYVDVAKYGIDLKQCSDVDAMYAKASEYGVELERVVTCK